MLINVKLFVIVTIFGVISASDVTQKCNSFEHQSRELLYSMSKNNQQHVAAINESEQSDLYANLLNVTNFNNNIDNIIGIDEHEKADNINVLAQRFLEVSPPFDITNITGISTNCRRDYKVFLDSLKRFHLWALKMHDASAKLASGILNGNVNQFGDFDQCLKVTAPANQFQGQYCLAYLQPEVTENSKYLDLLHKLVQSHEPFKSNFDDPGHRVPRVSTINWALCVPSTCSSKDVHVAIKQFLGKFTENTGIRLKIRVNEEMCQTMDHNWQSNLDSGTKTAALVFLAIFLLSIISTIYEFWKRNDNNKNSWLTAFSLMKNTNQLISLKREDSDIKTAHGIRFFNATMLIISHKCMAMFFNPYVNRTEMSEEIGRPWTVIGRAAAIYTDPFIMLSGMLTAYSLFGRLMRGHKIQIWKEYAGRYLRMMPPLAALILFCTYILPLLGSGPQWNLVVTHHSGICKQYWWRNFLFIHNYFGFENMCLTHTHHIGIDSQLFFTAPFFVFLLWKWPRNGLITIVGLALVSTAMRFYVTFTKHLSNYVFFGTSVTQLFKTADYMYILPTHRFTVYAIGLLLGYVLRMHKGIRLSKTQLKIGWYINTAIFLLSFLGPAPMGSINYVFSPLDAANYAAFAPFGWCFFFAWIIFTSENGYSNFLTRALEWDGFLWTTRISYSIYLTQFPVFFYNVGRVRAAQHFGFVKIVANLNEYVWMVLVSIALTIFIEFPFTNIKKILFNNRTVKTSTKLSSNNNDKNATNKNIKYDINTLRNLLD